MNASTALALVNTIQSKASGCGGRRAQRRRSRPAASMRIIGASIGVGAESREPVDELRRLFARPRHEHAPAEQRACVEPAQVLAQSDDAADDERGRLAPRVLAAASSSSSASVPDIVCWSGSVPL